MSLQSVLSSDQILISGFIVSIFSAIIFSIDGVTASVLFFCGVFIGATLTREFLRGYSSNENSNSVDEENPQAKSVPTWKDINEVLLSPQVGKYLFFFILISIILIGGLWGTGQVGVGPLASSYEISGQVVDQGNPVAGVSVTIKNSTGDDITTDSGNTISSRLVETDDNGKYSAELPIDGTYNVAYDGETYEEVEPGSSNIDFPKDQSKSSSTESEEGFSGSLIPDWVPIGGGGGEDDGSGGNDGESTNDEPESQSIPFVEGKVVNSENREGVKFATVTVLNQDNEEIPSTRNETDLDGNYRVENIPPEAFAGDIDQGTLRLKVEKEGVIETSVIEVELDIRTASTGIDSGTDFEVKI